MTFRRRAAQRERAALHHSSKMQYLGEKVNRSMKRLHTNDRAASESLCNWGGRNLVVRSPMDRKVTTNKHIPPTPVWEVKVEQLSMERTPAAAERIT